MKVTNQKFAGLQKKLEFWRKRIDQELGRHLSPRGDFPHRIHRAMRYSVLNGGKRLRPILAIGSSAACGGVLEEVILPACAIEIFHSFSLVHDDLPALDNDDLRRGRPSCHRQFGEAAALLAGDALLNLGYELLAAVPGERRALRLIREFSLALGTDGMIGGQSAEKELESVPVDRPKLDYVHARKTAALMEVSCVAGAISARAGRRKEEALRRFGRALGLAFQMVDDIMDRDGYVNLMGESAVQNEARKLTERAKGELELFGSRANTLRELADFLLSRDR